MCMYSCIFTSFITNPGLSLSPSDSVYVASLYLESIIVIHQVRGKWLDIYTGSTTVKQKKYWQLERITLTRSPAMNSIAKAEHPTVDVRSVKA